MSDCEGLGKLTGNALYLAILGWDSLTLAEWEQAARKIGHRPRKSFRDDRRYLEHVAGRGVLGLLAKKIGWDITLSTGVFGEPRVEGRQDSYASISHTAEIAVGVLGTHPVGIDIERQDRKMSEKAIQRVCLKSELKSLSPIFLWSAKEAVSKALGIGIKFGMHVFEIIPLDKTQAKVVLRQTYPTPFALRDAQVSFILHKNWVVSVCSEKSAFTTPVQRINLR